MVWNDGVTYYPVLQIILQLITLKMVKRGKVPKTKISLSNKQLYRMSKNLAKTGENNGKILKAKIEESTLEN